MHRIYEHIFLRKYYERSIKNMSIFEDISLANIFHLQLEHQ